MRTDTRSTQSAFPHMLFMVYPHMLPTKTPPPQQHSPSNPSLSALPPSYAPTASGAAGSTVGSVSTASAAAKVERYRPRIFGFQVNEIGKLMRWQEAVRDKSVHAQDRFQIEFVLTLCFAWLSQANRETGGTRRRGRRQPLRTPALSFASLLPTVCPAPLSFFAISSHVLVCFIIAAQRGSWNVVKWRH